MIYQTNGLEPVYETIKKKILTEQSEWSTTTVIKTIKYMK
jgi:hypothetical protein